MTTTTQVEINTNGNAGLESGGPAMSATANCNPSMVSSQVNDMPKNAGSTVGVAVTPRGKRRAKRCARLRVKDETHSSQFYSGMGKCFRYPL